MEVVVLPDHGRAGNSRKRTGHILLFYIVLGSWQPPNPALQGSWTTANTNSESESVVNCPLGLDVNPDEVDNNCRMLPLWPAEPGCERVVKMLVE